jgi:hypothetical protein
LAGEAKEGDVDKFRTRVAAEIMAGPGTLK